MMAIVAAGVAKACGDGAGGNLMEYVRSFTAD